MKILHDRDMQLTWTFSSEKQWFSNEYINEDFFDKVYIFTFSRMFPSLVNCCTIDWFTEWPEDALEKVATKFLEDMDMEDEVIVGAAHK